MDNPLMLLTRFNEGYQISLFFKFSLFFSLLQKLSKLLKDTNASWKCSQIKTVGDGKLYLYRQNQSGNKPNNGYEPCKRSTNSKSCECSSEKSLTRNGEEKNTLPDLAYCMSTSGTTGDPKVVRVPHGCIVPNILHLGYVLGENNMLMEGRLHHRIDSQQKYKTSFSSTWNRTPNNFNLNVRFWGGRTANCTKSSLFVKLVNIKWTKSIYIRRTGLVNLNFLLPPFFPQSFRLKYLSA